MHPTVTSSSLRNNAAFMSASATSPPGKKERADEDSAQIRGKLEFIPQCAAKYASNSLKACVPKIKLLLYYIHHIPRDMHDANSD